MLRIDAIPPATFNAWVTIDTACESFRTPERVSCDKTELGTERERNNVRYHRTFRILAPCYTSKEHFETFWTELRPYWIRLMFHDVMGPIIHDDISSR